jgi:hypothetical protein
MKGIMEGDCAKRGLCAALALSVSLCLILGALIAAGCGKTKPSLQYEPDPGTVVVRVEAGGGLPFPGDDLVPLFQLFGDGRVVKWQGEAGGRGVLAQGRISPEDTAELLQRLSDAGLFQLKEEYRDASVYDATYRNIYVKLAEAEKVVRVWMTMEVPQFDKAYDLIMDFPVGNLSEYVPEKGYLVVVNYPQEAAGEWSFLDPNSEIYKLLPDVVTLSQAAESHTAMAVDGSVFLQLKKYDNQQSSRGLYIRQPDGGCLAVYPVYEPRAAKKP